ncbi:MAG: sigma-70 family RNA polymerase sigma factor [Planctomycetota bacterium]
MNNTSANESDLIDRAKDGDREAFTVLVRRYQDYVHNAVVHMVGRGQDAEDLSQEVFLKAFRGISGFKQRSKFSTWLYGIMLNCVRSFWRRQGRGPDEVSLDAGGDPDCSAPDPKGASHERPLDHLLSKERVEIVRAAIHKLDPKRKEVIVLRDLQGLSYKELATCLEVPVGTIKSRLARARSALREKIEQVLGSSV